MRRRSQSQRKKGSAAENPPIGANEGFKEVNSSSINFVIREIMVIST